MGSTDGFVKSHSNDDACLLSGTDQFRTHRCATKSAKIFVFVPLGEHEEKPLAYGHRSVASRTVKLSGIKFLERFFLGRSCRRKGATPIEETTVHSKNVRD